MNDQGANSARAADPMMLLEVGACANRELTTEELTSREITNPGESLYLTVTIASFDGWLVPATLTARILKYEVFAGLPLVTEVIVTGTVADCSLTPGAYPISITNPFGVPPVVGALQLSVSLPAATTAFNPTGEPGTPPTWISFEGGLTPSAFLALTLM